MPHTWATTASRSLAARASRIAGTSKLNHRIARELCNKGVLRADEDKVLLVFTRTVYPELNPVPERKLIERLEKAIFGQQREIDPRTVVLLSLFFLLSRPARRDSSG